MSNTKNKNNKKKDKNRWKPFFIDLVKFTFYAFITYIIHCNVIWFSRRDFTEKFMVKWKTK